MTQHSITCDICGHTAQLETNPKKYNGFLTVKKPINSYMVIKYIELDICDSCFQVHILSHVTSSCLENIIETVR
jgi:hypothetical protein